MLYRDVCPTAVLEVHGLDSSVECVNKNRCDEKRKRRAMTLRL